MFVTCRTVSIVCAVIAAVAIPIIVHAPAPAGATVYFINLKDVDMLTSPFKVQFGMTGMGIAPAGIERPNTGHHHVLVDTRLSDAEAKAPLPADMRDLHFGGGAD